MNEDAKEKDGGKNSKTRDAQQTRAGLYGEVISHMRAKHPDIIDAAYDFFWEEEYPEEFLSGLPLELGFVNFEDWFICDYTDPNAGFMTDLYLEDTGQKENAGKVAAMKALKDSFISLYEVKKIAPSSGGQAELEDVLLGGTLPVSVPASGMKAGDLLATRVIDLEGRCVMGACLYPFGGAVKKVVLESVSIPFERYRKNKKPGGGLRDFLKDEGYIFNVIWLSGLYRRA